MAQRIAMRRSLRISGNTGSIQSYFLTAKSSVSTAAAVVPNILTTTNTAPSQPYHSLRTIDRLRSHRSIHTSNPLYSSESSESKPAAAATAEEEIGSVIDPETECPIWNNPIIHAEGRTKISLDDYEEGEAPPIAPLPPVDLNGDDGVERTLASPELHALADEIVMMNMMEVKELVDRVAEHFGIEDDEPMVMGGGGGGGGEGGEVEAVEEEKTAFDLKLTGFDAKTKIKVIKEVRAITALGLKEAKAMVDGVPSVVKSGISKDEAEEIKAKLEGLGATVEVV